MHRLSAFLRRVAALCCGVLSASAFAQTPPAAPAATPLPPRGVAEILEEAGNLSDAARRSQAVSAILALQQARRQAGQARADELGLPRRLERPDGTVIEVDAVDEQGRPIFLVTHNLNAAISSGADLLLVAPYNLNGSGFTAGVWDGGSARATHQEFGTRVTVMDGAGAVDHATHVAGTIAAAGVVASARGMAPAVRVDSYDWNSDKSEMTARGAATPGDATKLFVSNHSYGYLSGWYRTGNSSPAYIWYGSGTTATSVDPRFGQYNTYARDSDSLAFNAPYYLMFRSAGNERIDNPSNGQLVQLSSTDSTTVSYDATLHPGGDGTYRGGFDTISFDAVGKNVITIGSVADAVTSGLRDPSKAAIASYSSWGPTDDGRIKPDLVANGESVYSTLSSSNTAYGNMSGTSMATPAAAGAAMLLVQEYARLFPNSAMRSSTLKGLLIHTADDRGNPGPDYKFGWGLINVKAAADLLRDHAANPLKLRLGEHLISTSTTTLTHEFVWDGSSPLRVTLSWTDPAGTATTSTDLRTPRLRNNLDLKLVAPNGTEYRPYVMPFVGTWTQESMNLTATTGINNTDNVEQVYLAAPPVAGAYRAVVSFQGTLANNQQHYSLLVSGSANEVPPPPPLTLSAVSPTSGIAGSTTTIELTGTALASVTTVKLTRAGQTDVVASSAQLSGDVLRAQFSLPASASGVWNVVASSASEVSTLANAFTIIGAVWSENFDGTVTGWASSSATGSNSWALSTTTAHTPTRSYFAAAPATKTTTRLNSPSITVPANATNLQLSFWHSFNLQTAQDGGRLELSVDNGATWFGVEVANGVAFVSNGYNSTISSTGAVASRSDFAGLAAWSGNSNGFINTVLNLTDTAKFAGKTMRLRWVIATNGSTSSPGWWIDSIVLLGGGDFTNQPPTITSAASTGSGETTTEDNTVIHVVRASSVSLSVTASDDGGASALTYSWSAASTHQTPVFFSPNETTAAREAIAYFEGPGDYVLTVAVRDAGGLTANSSVNVRVVETLDGIVITPGAATLSVGDELLFIATALDQFGDAMTVQPTTFAWAASGGGSIDTSGRFTATTAGGPFAITATSGAFVGTASATVLPASATITLGNLQQTYDGTPRTVSVTTAPAGLATSVTHDGEPTPPTAAGTYAIEAAITDPNYSGSATATLTVAKAIATVTLGNLSQIYDGTPRTVTVTTAPAGLATSVTYNGEVTPPTSAGSYAVAVSISDPNYSGSANGTLTITPAPAAVTLGNLEQTYDGTARVVSVVTNPSGLAASVTYDGQPTPPTNAGTYAIDATITDPNYSGSATATLTVAKALATVTLGDLSQIYDGTPRTVSVTTAPAGLATSVTYNGEASPPIEPGEYAVAAAVSDVNYAGSAAATLTIHPQTYFLSVIADPADGGSVTGSGTYAAGSLVTISATAADGWEFVEWIGSDVTSLSSANTTVLVDAAKSVTARFVALLSPVAPFNAWADSSGLEGEDALPRADPDGDGRPNLLEYAFGSDPTRSDATTQPELVWEGGQLICRFHRNPDSAADTLLQIERSTNLTDWSTLPPIAVEGVGVIEVALPVPESGMLFVRIAVTLLAEKP